MKDIQRENSYFLSFLMMPLGIILYSKPPISFMHRESEEKRKLCDNECYHHTIASACPAREA